MLQNDLHKLYKWTDTNNMKFNAKKLEILRYGKELEIKSSARGIVGRVTDCGVRGLWFKSPGIDSNS